MVRLTDHPNLTIAIYHGRKATKQQLVKTDLSKYMYILSFLFLY